MYVGNEERLLLCPFHCIVRCKVTQVKFCGSATKDDADGIEGGMANGEW